jgi:hypothetical protein
MHAHQEAILRTFLSPTGKPVGVRAVRDPIRLAGW